MVLDFFHGARVQGLPTNLRSVRQDNDATIALVGVAPQGPVNTPTQILSVEQSLSIFGADGNNYTIPLAIEKIYSQITNFGSAKVIVVNAYDPNEPGGPSSDPFVQEAEQINIAGWLPQDQYLFNVQLNSLTVTNLSVGCGGTTMTEGVDYTIDLATGTFNRIVGQGISNGDNILFDFVPFRQQAEYTFDNGDEIQLATALSFVKIESQDRVTEYILDTDYSVDLATGLVTRLGGGSITANETVLITYNAGGVVAKLPTDVTDADIIAALNTLNQSYTLFGYMPRILIAPYFSNRLDDSNSAPNVAAAMEVVANDIDAVYGVDATFETEYNDLITGRGSAGTINFNFSSPRMMGFSDRVRSFRSLFNSSELMPTSMFWAGAYANSIVARGFWYSPSYIPLIGVNGKEFQYNDRPGKLGTEVQVLNANGITTVINRFSQGFMIFGNRNFSFPANTSPLNFISVQFSDIVVSDALQRLCEQFVDRPINDALIDLIITNGNLYIQFLVNQGALIPGSRFYYNVDNNPSIELSQGVLKIEFDVMYPPPAEQILIRRQVNILLLENLNEGRTLVNISGAA